MANPYEIADYASSLFRGLSGFWQRFFRDTKDLESFYQASEQYLGQVYLDLLSTVLSTSVSNTPIFNKEVWKLFAIGENELSFAEGLASTDDRFIYDMPGTAVDVEVLQNSILEPSYVLEKDLDFETSALDGYMRFVQDPFRQAVDNIGEHIPAAGVAWRWVDLLVGNVFYDLNFAGDWVESTDVRRGNTLRLLAYRGAEVQSHTTGQLTYTGALSFQDAAATFTVYNRGDIIEVYGDPSGTALGRYLIKDFVSTTSVNIDDSVYLTPTVTTAANLSWRLVRAIYYDYGTQDYEIDFFQENKFVGKSDTPYPLDKSGPFIYAVIREPVDDTVTGVTVNAYTDPVTVTDLGSKHLKVGSVEVFATRLFDGNQVQENIDYTVDYMRGIITPVWYAPLVAITGVGDGTLTDMGSYATFTTPITGAKFYAAYDIGGTIIITSGSNLGVYVISDVVSLHVVKLADSGSVTTDPGIDWTRTRASNVPAWDPASAYLKCSYKFYREVLLSASGTALAQTSGQVKQLSFWVPEVLTDRFTLYNNYGSMLNRFEASSETYRAFLRGIMYLYVSGPILQRVESALNVATGLPVILSDGETLTSYDSGLTYSGSDGVFVTTTTTFASASATFSSLDVGGYVVIKYATNDVNRARFRVLTYVDAHTVEVEAEFGVIDESAMTWEFSRSLLHTVTTETTGGVARVYTYPYWIPMRTDLVTGATLTFNAFDVLTEAFRVTDYLVDPTWWHNKFIPEVLWGNTTSSRRLAAATLVENIFDPVDDACVDDPGLFFDATEEGIIIAPTDPYTGDPAPMYRHTAAFILFDRYLKMHMFYVGIDPDVELTQEFIDDINNLVLVAKPSYTYPYVEPGEDFRDTLALLEVFNLSGINFAELETLGIVAKGLFVDHDILLVGDYYRYDAYDDQATGETAPLSIGDTFTIPPVHAREYFVTLRLNATVDGERVIEDRDYSIDLDPLSASYGEVTVLTNTWDAGAITFDAQTVVLYNEGLGTPDTRLGFTPLAVDGLDPTYLRDTSTEQSMIDRAVMVTIDVAGAPYIYV